jgi:hypothetical protein
MAPPRNDGGTRSAEAAALGAQKGAAIRVDRLSGDVARGGAAQGPHHRRDVVRLAAFARDRAMGQMVRGFRPVLRSYDDGALID